MWVRKDSDGNETLRGELGKLKEVRASIVKPYQRCFLIVEHDGAEYLGCLLFRDDAVCRQIYELLLPHHGCTMEEIGDLDVSRVLRTQRRPSHPARRMAALRAQ